MIKKTLFVLLVINFTTSVYSQTIHSGCYNYNEFRSDSTILSQLEPVTDTILDNGYMYINSNQQQYAFDKDDLLQILNLDPFIHFELQSSNQSRFDDDLIYQRFHQLYKNILVEGGGFAIGTGGGGGTVSDECGDVYSISPYIITGINTTYNT